VCEEHIECKLKVPGPNFITQGVSPRRDVGLESRTQSSFPHPKLRRGQVTFQTNTVSSIPVPSQFIQPPREVLNLALDTKITILRHQTLIETK
jgi:hypothetical protein